MRIGPSRESRPFFGPLFILSYLIPLASSSVPNEQLNHRQVSNVDSIVPSFTSVFQPGLTAQPSVSQSSDDSIATETNDDSSETLASTLDSLNTQTSPSSGSGFFSTIPPFTNFTTTSILSESTGPSSPQITSTVTQVPITTQRTITHIITDSSGRSSTSIDVIPTTTMVPSNDPSLVNGGGSGSEAGVTTQQKKIIIGVVVSIVGVLSIAGIAGLVWRIWFRGRKPEEEVGAPSKPSDPSSLSRSSFQNTESVIYTNSSGDYRKKSTTGNLDPSSNF